MSDRTFSEDEIARILKRASELELERGKTGYSGKGLTLDEIQTIASESGLDPNYVKKAAEEMSSPESTAANLPVKTVFNGSALVAETWLDYIPDQKSIDTVIADLDHRFQNNKNDFWQMFGFPKTKRNGKIIEWNHTDPFGYYETSILMQPVGQKYRIRLNKRNTSGLSWEHELPLMHTILGAVFLTAILGSSFFLDYLWAGVAVTAVLLVLLYPQLKKYNSRRKQKHIEEAKTLIEEIAFNFTVSEEAIPEKQHAAKSKTSTIKEDDINPVWEETEPGSLKNKLRSKE